MSTQNGSPSTLFTLELGRTTTTTELESLLSSTFLGLNPTVWLTIGSGVLVLCIVLITCCCYCAISASKNKMELQYQAQLAALEQEVLQAAMDVNRRDVEARLEARFDSKLREKVQEERMMSQLNVNLEQERIRAECNRAQQLRLQEQKMMGQAAAINSQMSLMMGMGPRAL